MTAICSHLPDQSTCPGKGSQALPKAFSIPTGDPRDNECPAPFLTRTAPLPSLSRFLGDKPVECLH